MSTRATTDPGARSAAEIEREVRESRAEIEQTLDRIQERLSPGQLFDQALTYFREGDGGQFTRNLGASVRDNPMPVALLALGVGWMMFSSQRAPRRHAERPDWEDDDLDDTEDRYPPYGLNSGLAEGPAYWDTATPESEGGLGDRVNETGEAVGDRMDEVGGRARDLGDRARDLGDRARERAQRVRRDVEDRMGSAREQMGAARERIDATRRRAGHYGRRVQRGLWQSFSEQPLVLGAIGLAVGAALGAALPPTETEDRLMGDARDEALRRATRAGRAQAEKARAAADAVVSAARDEVTKQATPGGDVPPAQHQP